MSSSSEFANAAANDGVQEDAAHGRGAIDALRRVLIDLRAAHGAQPVAEAPRGVSASDETSGEREEAEGPEARLGDILDGLHERAFGLLLLLCALPCCIPFLYGVPQIMALPLLALAAQLAAGRDVPWLPGSLRNRKASIAALENVLDRSARYVGWFEKLARPRLLALSDGAGVRVVGALMLIPCASILTPLPATNTTPGIAVAVIAVGLMERDGLMILAGLVLGLLWVALLVFLAATLGLSALGSVREALTGLI